MKKEELKIINKLINQLDNLKKIKEEEIRKEENESDKEIEEEMCDEDCNEIEKINGKQRMVLALELQRFINLYSEYKDCQYICKPDNYLGEFSKKSFKIKIFELSSIIIKRYVNVNEKYFNIRNLEQLVRILDRILKIDYRKEKESMARIKALIKFCKID